MAYVRRVALRPTLADLSGEDNELSMRKILDPAGITPFGWIVRTTLPIFVAAAWRGVQFLIKNPK